MHRIYGHFYHSILPHLRISSLEELFLEHYSARVLYIRRIDIANLLNRRSNCAIFNSVVKFITQKKKDTYHSVFLSKKRGAIERICAYNQWVGLYFPEDGCVAKIGGE